MSNLYQSFTLPTRGSQKKKKKLGNHDFSANDGKELHLLTSSPGLSRSELNLCTSDGTNPKDGGGYYGLDKIEDIFKLKERMWQGEGGGDKHKYPDFYGGYPLPMYPSVSNKNNPSVPSASDGCNTSDYESGTSENISPSSENDSLCSSSTALSSASTKLGNAFKLKPWNTMPVRLRKSRSEKYYKYGVIKRLSAAVHNTQDDNITAVTSGSADSNTYSTPLVTQLDVCPTLRRAPTQFGIIPNISTKQNNTTDRGNYNQCDDSLLFSNLRNLATDNSTTHEHKPPSSFRSDAGGRTSVCVGSGADQLVSSSSGFHCCCRNSCHKLPDFNVNSAVNPIYKINFHCCHQMEPLWENSAKQSKAEDIKWYERKWRPKSCPSMQAHMVAAFEQSLSNMTSRLQHLTASAEQKDSELNELRSTIEALKKQSSEAGLAKMALQSMQAVQRSTGTTAHLVRRHTFNTTKDSALQEHRISRQLSTDSMSSVNSISSACSGASGNSKSGENVNGQKKKKKGWLRSSFSKAFSRSKKNKNGSVSDVEDLHQFQSDSSTPSSPLLGLSHHTGGGMPRQNIKVSHSSSALYEKEDESVPEIVRELRKQLREKDMVLTDIRLEALTSAHQLEGLKDTVNKMRSEMINLKHDNERLQKLVSSKSLASSQSSLPHKNSVENIEKRLSSSDHSGSPSIDICLNDVASDREGKRVTISVFLGCHGDYNKYVAHPECLAEVFIGTVSVSGKTKWDLLDNVVKRAFKEYVLRVDPVSNLGLNAESVTSYHIGEIERSKDAEIPELLPCGYLVGDNMQIKITLKGTKHNAVDALVFETLLPKSIIQRYVSLLTEHRRIILCGPSGTGKTYLAQKLAEFLVLRSGKELTAGSVATFSVDHKSAKELRQYLSNVAEQCESSNASDLPTVIILDNLHHVGSLGEVFNGFLSAKYQKCPYIIGTMNQATCSTTNLQLHHNFRWVLCANHMEPVKGFLGRYLRRKLIEEEVRGRAKNLDLTKIIDWMPKAWQHLNKFLETHSSSDVTIGPRLFLSCPVDVASSQVWFTDLWNYSIVPYLMEAVREGLQLYGRRAPWEDPAEWVLETYPWPPQPEGQWPQLLRLRPEDVGYEGHPGPGLGSKTTRTAQGDVESDPLLNMLMRLQEAASYSSPHSVDSDSTSLDSHSGGGLHTEDLITTGLESTL